MNKVYAILIAAALLGLYIYLRSLNAKTPVPKGCEDLGPDCQSCGLTDCSVRKKDDKKEGEKSC